MCSATGSSLFPCIPGRNKLTMKRLEACPMRRREFIAGLGVAAWPAVTRAQQG
jgi:hypothetical protein